MSVLAMGCERVVRKAAVIAVIMPDCHTVMQGKLFERLFCSNGFVRQEVAHKVDILDVREVVNENGGGGETLLGKFSF